MPCQETCLHGNACAHIIWNFSCMEQQTKSFCVENTSFFDCPNFASGFYPLEYAPTFGMCWSVNLYKACRTYPSCFWMAWSEGAAQFSRVFCILLQHDTVRTNSLYLTAFAFSTTASVDALSRICQRLPSISCALVVDKLPSTVDVRAEMCPSASRA